MKIEIPRSGPLFEGHFPGRPILPAVALLDRIVRALAGAAATSGADATSGATESSAALRGIANLRLRQPVTPGDVLDLEAPAAEAGGRVRFDLRRAAARVADGVVLMGTPSAVIAPWPPASGTRSAESAPPLDVLLPHRPPMRMIEAIEAGTGDGLACSAHVPAGSAFDAAGAAPALVALEMAAQAAALFEALRRTRDSGSSGARLGYLVGARDVEFGRATLPVGASHHAAIRLVAVALPFSQYAFEVSREGEVVASGTLSTWITTTAA